MNHWQAIFLGLKRLSRELSGFEIEAFFTFSARERAVIEARRDSSLKLGLALQIGFLRMSGRLLDAVRIVPPALWKHLGDQFGEQAPDLASLRAMYRRHRTLFDHQELACEALGFRPLIEAQRRTLGNGYTTIKYWSLARKTYVRCYWPRSGSLKPVWGARFKPMWVAKPCSAGAIN